MLLTVAICTRNRAASLRRVLSSLVECETPADASWEIVVVDNGSTDETPAVLREFNNSLPLRVTIEPTAGLSRARNAAVHSARGDYIAWTDDDCIVARQWLIAYIDAFRRWPHAGVFGGPIVPRFEAPTPAWLARVAGRVQTAYAARDFGVEPVALSLERNRVPFGANYAIRAVEQRSRRYDTRLGRVGGLPIRVGEESEVLRGLLRDGVHGRWVSEAAVVHCIPPERQRLAYLREYYLANGEYEEWRRHTAAAATGSQLDGVSSFQLFRGAVRSELQYQVRRLLRDSESWIGDFIAANVARGRIRARRELARRKRATAPGIGL